ncbi:MAG: PAS domain-containing protein, partial [Deltaproteobacteria bacterium]|nr:PAS domain-containing protein [Deltaproteobacteria bacterium]
MEPGTVPPPIAESWDRCYRAEVEFAGGRCQDILSTHDLETRQNCLVEAAHPLLIALQKLLRGFGFIIVLVDHDGYILKGMGDLEALRRAEKINFGPGSNWSELSVGTNAIGTALTLGRSIQVTGPEHYNDGHHLWTCAATPIFDPAGGIVGCLDISGPRENSKFPIMEMVLAWARVIEDRLHMELAQEDLRRRNVYMNAALESVGKGLIALDTQGIINSVNSSASKLLGLTPQELVGRQISATPLDGFVRLIGGQASTEHQLASLKTKSGHCHCLVTTTPINDGSWPGGGSVITLSEATPTPSLKTNRSGDETRYTFEDIIGESAEISATVTQARMAAPN